MSSSNHGARAAWRTRAALASLSVALACACISPSLGAAGAAPAVAPNQTQLPDGLTLVTRKATASPTAALEIWIKCPASGYGVARPGIARLTALALVEDKSAGLSLRDEAKKSGAQIAISVYQESTEVAILAPANLSNTLLDRLLGQALHPRLDQAAFEAARQRLAAQQVASVDMIDQVLRDSLFAHMFASGPLHDSTYGDPKTLTGMGLSDITGFAARAYVPANEIVVAVGDVDGNDVARRVGAAAPAATAAQSMPESTVAAFSDAPLALNRESIPESGVAIGWVGPPIQDQRAATAMDFLSDYLTHPTQGVVTRAVDEASADTLFGGQFVTLRNPGIFYVTASGDKLDPTIASGTIRDAMRNALRGPLSASDFERARAAFVTHLLRDMQTAQGMADNYGWYFAQGALSYSPSATDTALSGVYFEQVATLTPDYVYSIARRYLLAKPAVVLLPHGPVKISGAQ
jgi:predicted Zn-dependent peptidase